MNRFKGKGLPKWIPVLFWLAVWMLISGIVDNDILVAAPIETAKRLAQLLGEGRFYLALGSSLLRIGAGFLAGFLLAVLTASASWRYRFLEELLHPFISLIKTVPVASFAVLLLVWWGPSFLAAAICFLVTLPGVYLNILEGLKSMDAGMLEMAEVFRLPFRNRFFYIYRPSVKPFLYGSLKISLGMCWKAGVAAEVIGIPDTSVGEGLYLSKVYLDTAGVFAWTGVIILLSVLLEKAVLKAASLFFDWEPACKGQLPCRKAAEKGGSNPDRGIFRRKAAGRQRSGEGAQPGPAEFRLTDVDKSYDGRQILDKVNAVYRRGERYWLTGPSGSGKTTLLRILAGLTEPDGGNLTGPRRCSMVFQEDRLCGEYSAVKNVELVTGDRERAERALGQLLEEEALHRPCRLLSGGMKRRVALVRAMEADSDCILLDEPFTGMDPETCRRAEEYIQSRQNGRILIEAAHIKAKS